MDNLKDKVYESLNNAMANGYLELSTWTPAEIAEDLKEYNPDFEDIPEDQIIPHIEAWLKEHE